MIVKKNCNFRVGSHSVFEVKSVQLRKKGRSRDAFFNIECHFMHETLQKTQDLRAKVKHVHLVRVYIERQWKNGRGMEKCILFEWPLISVRINTHPVLCTTSLFHEDVGGISCSSAGKCDRLFC